MQRHTHKTAARRKTLSHTQTLTAHTFHLTQHSHPTILDQFCAFFMRQLLVSGFGEGGKEHCGGVKKSIKWG